MDLLLLFQFILILLLSLSASSADAACTLSSSEDIGSSSGLTRESCYDCDNDQFTMRITYSGGSNWIGIGISDFGAMIGSNVVVGRSTSDSCGEVYKSQLTSKLSLPTQNLDQDLISPCFKEENGNSILEFTAPIKDFSSVKDGVITVCNNLFIW